MADYDQLAAAFNLPGNIGDAYKETVLYNEGAVPAAGLATTKTTRVLRVPKGFVLYDIRFRIGDGDTDGTPAVTFDLGDAGDPDRLLTASTLAQAGGESTALNNAGFGYEFTADTDILLTCVTSADAAAAAAFKIALGGRMK